MRTHPRSYRRKMSVALCPPKPKELLIATSDLGAARLVGHVVEVALRVGELVVDGRRHAALADGRMQAIASTPPPAPSRCPVMLLVLLTGMA